MHERNGLPVATNFIDGVWSNPVRADLLDTVNPANGAVIGHYSPAGPIEINAAIHAACRAFFVTPWSAQPRLRAAALLRAARILATRKPQLTELIVNENGKLRVEAAAEVEASISELEYYAGLARNIIGRMVETAPGNVSLLPREAAGVAAVIVPWNSPATLLVRSLAPALAAGCTAVIKPAAQTPLSNALLVECLAEANLPAGVINSINDCGTEVGEALVRSDDIDVVSFTGSSRTGKKIMRAAADSLKRLSLELGGKAPCIVFEDADLDAAASELTRATIVMAGQMCVAATRFLVHESIFVELRDRLKQAFSAVRVGPGADPASQMGALIDLANRDRVLGLIEEASLNGRMVVRGESPEGLGRGAFVTPTLFEIDDVSSPLVQEELFAPMASLERFSNEAEAIEKANATRYGLAASLWTRDVSRSMRVARALRTGTIWINSHLRLMAEVESGGFGLSGLGRLHGVEGLNDFLQTKHVYLEAGWA